MANLIEARVELARRGENPMVITQMSSGWLVMGDVQTLPGYCLLLSDPVVSSLNDLDEHSRIDYSLDVIRVGDALLALTDAFRINYQTLCNEEPSLHTHIIPRYMSEPEDKRRGGAMAVYDWRNGRKFDPTIDTEFMERMREWLT